MGRWAAQRVARRGYTSRRRRRLGEVVHGYLQALQDERGVAGLDPCQKAGPGPHSLAHSLIHSITWALTHSPIHPFTAPALFPDELGIKFSKTMVLIAVEMQVIFIEIYLVVRKLYSKFLYYVNSNLCMPSKMS